MARRPDSLEPALALIKQWEGCPDGDPSTVNLDPYLDPIGIWTIGWGHVVRDATGRMFRGKAKRAAACAVYPNGITRTEAEALLATDVQGTVAAIEAAVRVELDANQFCALTSWTFNVGAAAMRSSTLVRRLNAGDVAAAAAELPKWRMGTDPTTGRKKVLPGLVNRRAAERLLFERPVAEGVGPTLIVAIERAKVARALALMQEATAVLAAAAA